MAAKYCLSQPCAWCLLLYQAINFGTRLSEKWRFSVAEHLQKCNLWVKEKMWHPWQDEAFHGHPLWWGLMISGGFSNPDDLWSQCGQNMGDNEAGETHPGDASPWLNNQSITSDYTGWEIPLTFLSLWKQAWNTWTVCSWGVTVKCWAEIQPALPLRWSLTLLLLPSPLKMVPAEL